MQQKLVKKNLANFDKPILDILIFLNLDHGFKFRYELDHSIRNSSNFIYILTFYLAIMPVLQIKYHHNYFMIEGKGAKEIKSLALG